MYVKTNMQNMIKEFGKQSANMISFFKALNKLNPPGVATLQDWVTLVRIEKL